MPVQSEKRPGLLERLCEERRAELIDWCGDLLDGVSSDYEVVVGEASDVLPEAAERLDADLIVVARTGERGSEPGLFRIGSVVEHLAHRVVRPLAVIAPGSPSVTSRIVLGVDGSEHGRPAVAWTARFAEATGARTTPVTINEPERTPGDIEAAERAVATEWQAPTTLLDEVRAVPVPTIPVADALIDQTTELDADLLVVGATGLGAVINARIGGTALGVLHRIERSMVLVPDDREH